MSEKYEGVSKMDTLTTAETMTLLLDHCHVAKTTEVRIPCLHSPRCFMATAIAL